MDVDYKKPTSENLKIEDIELDLSVFSKENSYSVEVDNDTIIYKGMLDSVKIEGDVMTALPILVKIIETPVLITDGFFKKTQRPSIDKSVNWGYRTWMKNPQPKGIIIENGEFITDRNNSEGYRSSLLDHLANNCEVTVSDTLLDKVFGPMEQELLEFYNKRMDFK